MLVKLIHAAIYLHAEGNSDCTSNVRAIIIANWISKACRVLTSTMSLKMSDATTFLRLINRLFRFN